jgi:hypothetical protein
MLDLLTDDGHGKNERMEWMERTTGLSAEPQIECYALPSDFIPSKLASGSYAVYFVLVYKGLAMCLFKTRKTFETLNMPFVW